MPHRDITAIPDGERAARRENAKRVLRESRAARIMQEMNQALLKGRGWFDEYDSGVIMKWGTGYTRRHIWAHIEGNEIWIRLREHFPCKPDETRARCDGEFHIYDRALWSGTEFLKEELKWHYDHAVAESSDD